MNKKMRVVMFLFIFASFMIIPEAQADLSTICLAINSQDSQLTNTLALQPDRSYYDYYLNLAIERNTK